MTLNRSLQLSALGPVNPSPSDRNPDKVNDSSKPRRWVDGRVEIGGLTEGSGWRDRRPGWWMSACSWMSPDGKKEVALVVEVDCCCRRGRRSGGASSSCDLGLIDFRALVISDGISDREVEVLRGRWHSSGLRDLRQRIWPPDYLFGYRWCIPWPYYRARHGWDWHGLAWRFLVRTASQTIKERGFGSLFGRRIKEEVHTIC